MAIKIGGKKPAPATEKQADLSSLGQGQEAASPPATEQTPPQTQASQPAPASPSAPQSAPLAGTQTPASFLMTGEAQRSAIQQVQAQQDLRAKLRGGAREFWLNPGEFAKLVFLDGVLDANEMFETPLINVHKLQIHGKYPRFVCNRHVEGQCVVCDSNGDGSTPETLQLFTVINVMPYTIQNGPNRGKTLPARIQLLPATPPVRQILVERAKQHGNRLAGGFYQFTRHRKQDARIGNDIAYLQDVDLKATIAKFPKLQQRQNAKGEWEDAPTVPYDYAKAYPVVTNADLAALRPDLAQQAGWAGPVNTAAQQQPMGASVGSDIDDGLPF